MALYLEMFRPGEFAESVVDIDCSALKLKGYDSLMLDLDNTLLPWKSSIVPDQVKDWVVKAKECGMKLVIVSNTHNPKRLEKVSCELNIPSIAHALKPGKSGFLKAAGLIGSDLSRTVVVGDQILTDVFGGNRSGMRTILVKPMHSYEFIGTKISRMVERAILRVLRRGGGTGTKLEQIQSEKQGEK